IHSLSFISGFPFGDKDRLHQWISNINRQDWKPTPHSHLCSHHFKQDCFIRFKTRVCLTSDAVPTVFHHNSHSQAMAKYSRRNKKRASALATNIHSDMHVCALTAVTHDHSYIGRTEMSCEDRTSDGDSTVSLTAKASSSLPVDHQQYTVKESPRALKRTVWTVQNRLATTMFTLWLRWQPACTARSACIIWPNKTEKIAGPLVRRTMTKMILFHHQ
uniref:THAP-type domain-containing protein n=1 Tax=Astyanax mexicanus TaxID=7994 RepID=A0A3B1J5L5_ASTMX